MNLKTLIEPRVYQPPVIAAVKKALEVKDEALFVMATGLGKSIVSALIIQEWIESGKRGLFLCHENYILEQVEEDYRNVLGNELSYKKFYGDASEKHWDADRADMLFASFQSLNNGHNKWYQAFEPDHFDFMIVDESQHGQARTFKEIIDYFKCKKIGMTAFPDRMDLKDIREIFGHEVYTITLEEGIANSWLCNVEYHILSDGIDNRKLKKICKEVLENGKRVSVKQINETIFIHNRDKEEQRIIDEYTHIKEHTHRKKTLLFCERTTHADNIIQHFENADVMHSKKSKKHNRKVFQDFCNDELQYVASVNKFNEGKHVPGVEGIVFLRATDSLSIWFQQLGRALAKTGTKTKVIILDFVANIERLIMVRDMMLRVKKIQDEVNKEKGIKLPLDINSFNVSGEGFDFIFSDEMVDIMKVVEALRQGYYSTCREASVAAIALGAKTPKEYKEMHHKNLRLPPNPQSTYEDFPGWDMFLGLSNVNLPLLLKDRNKVITLVKIKLRKNKITDYWSMKRFHLQKLAKIDFGVLGTWYGVVAYLLEKASPSLTHKTVDKFLDVLGWSITQEEKIQRYKEELAKHGIKDYWTLYRISYLQFSKKTFGSFGKGTVFLKIIINRRVKSDSDQDLYELTATTLGWTLSGDQKIQRYKEELAKHEIKDHLSLMRFGVQKFGLSNFGTFGKGQSFLSAIINSLKVDYVMPRRFLADTLSKISEVLGWKPDEEQRLIPYKVELAKHGIKDYWTLTQKPYSPGIRKKDFGSFGKGTAFCSSLLQKSVAEMDGDIILSEISDVLGWTPKSSESLISNTERLLPYKAELAKHGIKDYWTFMHNSSRIVRLEFGDFGKSKAFFTSLFKKDVPLTKVSFEEAAEILGWGITQEEKIQRYKEELAKHKITDYWTLFETSTNDFRALDFGIFRKGGNFFLEVVGETMKGERPLLKLSKKLGWVETNGIPKYQHELIANKITNYWELLFCSTDDFRALDFGFFGKGTAFCCHVLGRSIKSVSTIHRIEIAKKIGWDLTEEAKNTRFKEELLKNGIKKLSDLQTIAPSRFEKLKFGIFGTGRTFIGYVLGEKLGKNQLIIKRDHLDQVGKKLF